MWPPYLSNHPIIVPTGVAWQNLGDGALTEAADLRALMQTGKDGIGSNNWVIAGSHTTTGKPLLANDMHLGIQMPSIWYEVGLHCKTVSASCPYNVTGFGVPRRARRCCGPQRQDCVGVTNLGPDVQDFVTSSTSI